MHDCLLCWATQIKFSVLPFQVDMQVNSQKILHAWPHLEFTGKWLSPVTTGVRPPPCAAFSFTKVDCSRVVLFGGRQQKERVNELYILDMSNWVCLDYSSHSSQHLTFHVLHTPNTH